MSQDPFRKQRILWFVTMNAIAVGFAVALFAGFLYGEGLDGFMNALIEGVMSYKIVVVLIAMSPLVASLLVGMAYAQRALRRKRAQALGEIAPST